jgi:hypothetical protein
MRSAQPLLSLNEKSMQGRWLTLSHTRIFGRGIRKMIEGHDQQENTDEPDDGQDRFDSESRNHYLYRISGLRSSTQLLLLVSVSSGTFP